MAVDENDWVPEPSEHAACAVCDGEAVAEISTVGRYEIAVRNVACVECGLVFVTPRPSPDAMAQFYRSQYRAQHVLPMQMRDGSMAHPGTPEYEDALMFRAEVLASNALGSGLVRPGDRVLDVGCRRGDALVVMNRTVPIYMHGIEPDVKSAQEAELRGISMHNGVMETFEPGHLRFDQIQIFHVLEHIHDPLAALVRLRGWLKPEGRLVIDVPDVDQPYGGLGFFFQYPHLYSFSAQSLSALLVRAGFRVVTVGKGKTLVVLAMPDRTVSDAPVPYGREQLGAEPLGGKQVASQLQLYDALERVRTMVLTGVAVNADIVCRILSLPALKPSVERERTHLFLATLEIAQSWLRVGRREDAIRILKSGRDGPRCSAVAKGFERVILEVEGGSQHDGVRV